MRTKSLWRHTFVRTDIYGFFSGLVIGDEHGDSERLDTWIFALSLLALAALITSCFWSYLAWADTPVFVMNRRKVHTAVPCSSYP